MKKKRRYIKPITELLIVAPPSLLTNSLDQDKKNGLGNRAHDTESSTDAPTTTNDTRYNGGIVESKVNPWGAWDEE